MTNDRFEKWDVVIEVDSSLGHKFVVEQVMEDGYLFRSVAHPGARVAYTKEFAWHLFVKIGRWNWKEGMEVDDG